MIIEAIVEKIIPIKVLMAILNAFKYGLRININIICKVDWIILIINIALFLFRACKRALSGVPK